MGADGGVFTYGDAHFYGSAGAVKLAAPVVGMARSADGLGYWLVGADGGVFSLRRRPLLRLRRFCPSDRPDGRHHRRQRHWGLLAGSG